MRFKKSVISVITALILVFSIPFSTVFAFDAWSEEIAYYKYNLAEEDWISSSSSPWYDLKFSGSQIVGRVHCRTGHVDKAFVIFIPFMGYYFVVAQEGDMKIDFTFDNNSGALSGRHAFYHAYIFGSSVQQTFYSFSGAGYLSSSNISCFQDVFLGRYWIFMQVSGDSRPDPALRSSISNFSMPTNDEQDEITGLIRSNSGQDKPFPSGSGDVQFIGSDSPSSTYPDGSPVPTNEHGNPLPTNQFGQPVPTLPNGMPAPTYPNGDVAQTYTNPDGSYETVPYSIYNNGPMQDDVGDHFSKLNGMISDLDELSSYMESNASDLSLHVDNTRNLIDGVVNWFPPAVIAVLVCGAIMIIAVKISGSGKS